MDYRLRSSFSVSFGLVLFGATAAGQVPRESPGTHGLEADQHVCLTSRLMASEEGRRQFAAARAAGKTEGQVRVMRPQSSIGDTLTFKVRQKVLLPVGEQEWETQRFVLKAAGMIDEAPGTGYQIWVEVDELEFNHVRSADIDKLEEALAEKTPEASFEPAQGIIANNMRIFGNPPDMDGDGIIDVLLTDIVEGQGGATVAGFFDPVDQNRLNSNSNRADILYLDTRPTIASGGPNLQGLLRTAAHEIQHLIHWNHDNNEELFVNEGQSEWAQVLNGYGIRTASYLWQGRPSTNIRLVNWDQEEQLREYQRAGLWTSFIADQLGPETAGSVTREPDNGASGYRRVFATSPGSPLLEDFVLDFHTANLVNDATLESRFAYVAEPLRAVSAVPDRSWNGGMETQMAPETIDLQAGGVVYLEWRSVKNFTLNAAVSTAQAKRVGVRLVAYGEQVAAPFWMDLDLTETEHFLAGSYDRVLAVVARTDLQFGITPIQLSATWEASDINIVEKQVGGTEWGMAFRISDTFDSGYATRFVRPDNEEVVRLSRVWLPNYFVSQFVSDEPQGAERDFRFVVLDSDGNGMPGDELLGFNVDDERPFESATSSIPIQFFELDLNDFRAELSALPDTFFIGSLNRPSTTDSNDLVVVTTEHAEENVSYIRGYAPWQRMWDVSLQSGGTLESHAAPVRAEFTVGQSTVIASPDVPSQEGDRLLANYPNPFSGRTTVSFSVSGPRTVTLDVYDVTGKRIVRLMDNRRVFPGRHSVVIDASGWAPGTYACVLQSGKQRRSRMMTVLR